MCVRWIDTLYLDVWLYLSCLYLDSRWHSFYLLYPQLKKRLKVGLYYWLTLNPVTSVVLCQTCALNLNPTSYWNDVIIRHCILLVLLISSIPPNTCYTAQITNTVDNHMTNWKYITYEAEINQTSICILFWASFKFNIKDDVLIINCSTCMAKAPSQSKSICSKIKIFDFMGKNSRVALFPTRNGNVITWLMFCQYNILYSRKIF